MKTLRYFKSQLSNNHGAVIVLVVFLIVLLLGIAAFAIDFGYRHLVRNELQNAADAAALAATRELGVIYKGMNYDLQQIYVADPTTIKPIALQAAFKNYAGDVASLVVNNGDVAIGIWDYSADPSIVDPFSANLNQPNAVRVTVRRDSYANGPITTFFAQVLNINTMEVSAIATAALGGQVKPFRAKLSSPSASQSIGLTTTRVMTSLRLHHQTILPLALDGIPLTKILMMRQSERLLMGK